LTPATTTARRNISWKNGSKINAVIINDDAGPLTLIERDALAPLPPRPSFEGVVSDALGDTAGADVTLRQASATIGDTAGDINDGFEGDYADALDDQLEAPGADVPQVVDQAIDAGADVETLHDSVSNVLPPVDTPVEFSYDEPQAPPSLGPSPGERTEPPPAPEGTES
jgi:hypothetical protein